MNASEDERWSGLVSSSCSIVDIRTIQKAVARRHLTVRKEHLFRLPFRWNQLLSTPIAQGIAAAHGVEPSTSLPQVLVQLWPWRFDLGRRYFPEQFRADLVQAETRIVPEKTQQSVSTE